MAPALAFHADAVVTGDAGIFRDGAVVVDDGGRVLAVGPAGVVLPLHTGARLERVRGVVFPGLVNAHTHVELSALRGQVRGGRGFVPWAEDLIGSRAELAPEDEGVAIERAADELVSFGTAGVGDVSNSLGAVHALARRGIGGAVFHEVFGLGRDPTVARVAALARERDEKVGRWPSSDLSYAPAPHTLYTTHPDAVRALLALARSLGARTTLHLAEHAGERRALEQADGPVVEWLERRVRPSSFPWPRRSPFAHADALGGLAADVILVHLTDARPDEIARVIERDAPIVLCPRSNLFIDVRLPPLLAMREAGARVALGTDSLASNASLDVLAEARALLDRFPTVPARELVAMATWNGALALGRSDLGRLAVGARPGIVAVLGESGEDPCAFLLRDLRAPRRWLVRRHPGEAS